MPAATAPHARIDISRLSNVSRIRAALDRSFVLVFPSQVISRADRWKAERLGGVNLSRKQRTIAHRGANWTAVGYSDAQVAFSFPLETVRASIELIVLSAIGSDDQIAPLTGKQVLNASCSIPLP